MEFLLDVFKIYFKEYNLFTTLLQVEQKETQQKNEERPYAYRHKNITRAEMPITSKETFNLSAVPC